ncbi:F0F1 ATP synthase subunit delta [Salinisphaera hydrothermalis]|uniref:ATP synthase subunit delta n=1 Tax=Salinisphaera hydrothermalis (strain C41B8) TaxID=1304275 RepID=A0A084IM85_SALHC|nr:F0F1 ATP synthase subunit delta [Salinisphaera hydrothermalis]KEZ77819.1 F0F1 ATP synthase subunit delta [Salinisphaera hydrothermalis C41B8]
MAERYTLARPYAEAVFELAQASGSDGLSQWSDALAALSAIVANESVAALMNNPRVSDGVLADAIIETGASDFSEQARNFVRLLIDNNRLSLAPEIAELFEIERAAAEDRLDVEVTSAVELSDAQQKALGEALEKRFDRKVAMTFAQDDSVIGGAVIRAGDLVIDGSLTAQLARMRQSLAH